MDENKKNYSINSSGKPKISQNLASSSIKKRHIKKDEKLSGIQKSAIFLLSVGSKKSSEIIKHLKDDEIQKIVKEIASIKSVDSELKEKIIKEFQSVSVEIAGSTQGGEEVAQEILTKSFGEDKAKEIYAKAHDNKPLKQINKADPEKISIVIKDEHPQTIATILAFIEPKVSAQVLSFIPEDMKSDIVKRIATLKKSNRDLLDTIEKSLVHKLEELPEKGEKAGGISAIVNILNSGISEKVSKQILDDLSDTDEELAEEIKNKLIKIEDIIFFLDRDVQKLLSKIDKETIAKALKRINEDVKDKIITNLSKRVYNEEIKPILLETPIRSHEIEDAQSEIIKIMRNLINNGEIFFSEEYVQ